MVSVIVVVGVVGAVLFAVYLHRIFTVQDELNPVGRAYFSALIAGDGSAAYEMLCADAQQRTSPDELSEIWQNARGEDAVFTTLAGTGPSGPWPWTDRASVGLRITAEHLHVTRYVEVTRQGDQWMVCPGPKTPFQGREPK